MKILFLTRRAWPSIGGVERHVFEISRELIKRGHEVTVVSEDDGISFIRRCLAETLPPIAIGVRGKANAFNTIKTYRIPIATGEKLKKFRIWGWLWKHRDLIKNADIIHAHDVGFWYWPFRFLYPRKPFFMTFHGWEEKFPVPLSHKIQRKISEKMAKGNICVGKYLTKWYGTKTDYVTYGGVVMPPPRGSTSHTPEVRTLFIGRLEEQTGITTYLKALRLLKKDRENFSLTVCGDGTLRKEAEKDGQVLGFVENVQPYLQNARFVFTSGYLSILEVMAEKKLIFSVFENPLKEDYLKLTPFKKFIIICQTPEELAEKIKYYLENPEKEKEMTEAAYNLVKGETWEKVTDIYLKLWGIMRGAS